MIIKSSDLKKFTKKSNFYLFYGENEGLKNELIKNEFMTKYTNNIYKYDEKEILENIDTFFNSITSKSFFEKEKLIIISRISEKLNSIINEIIEKNIENIRFIFIAKILEKKSKIRNLFEKEKNLICIPCYLDATWMLNQVATNFFRTKKISISQQIINTLIDRCRGDRQNLTKELEKIEMYSKNNNRIGLDEILKLTNLAENYQESELIDNCLGKNSKKVSTILNENIYTLEDSILIIRTFLFKTKRLLKLKKEIVENKKNLDYVITNFRPPIFWKDKEIVKKQLNSWSLSKIEKLITDINNLELMCKKKTNSSTNILSDFIISTSSIVSN